MNIEIKLKTEKKVTVDFWNLDILDLMTQFLQWIGVSPSTSRGDIYGKGVQINEEYANGRINELMGLELTALQVYDLESGQKWTG